MPSLSHGHCSTIGEMDDLNLGFYRSFRPHIKIDYSFKFYFKPKHILNIYTFNFYIHKSFKTNICFKTKLIIQSLYML